nr:hypothetical protein [Paenibacillus xylanexedens]
MSKNSKNKKRKERRQRKEKRERRLGVPLTVAQTTISYVPIAPVSLWEPGPWKISPNDHQFLKILKGLMQFFDFLRFYFDVRWKFEIFRPIATLLLLAPVINSSLKWVEKVFVYLNIDSSKFLHIPYEVAAYYTDLHKSIEELNIAMFPITLMDILVFILGTGVLTQLGALKNLEENLTPKNILSMFGIYVLLFMNSKYILPGELGQKFVLAFAVGHVSLLPAMLDIRKEAQIAQGIKSKAKKSKQKV